MKANLTGLGGIKGLFLAHGEKLGMAIVIALALFLVYKALQQQTLEAKFQPDKLEEQIQKVKSDVATSSWDQAPPGEVRHVSPIEKAAETMVPGKLYLGEHWQIGPDPPVVPPVVLRTDPILLAAQKLEANGGSGLLAFTNDEIRKQRELEMQEEQDRKAKQQEKESERLQKEGERGKPQRPGANLQGERGGRGGELIDPEHPNRRLVTGIARQAGIPTVGDEEIRTAYWATVLAKVPIKEQFNIYRSAFENARGYDPQSDFPRYLGFKVQRVEVLPGEEGKEPDWKDAKDVSVYNGKGTLIGSVVSLLTLNGREADEATGKRAQPGVTSDWAAQPEEVVDPRYLDDDGVLAFPLPPLVGRDWGLEATHTEIPLASKATDAEPETPQPEDKNVAPATPADEEFAAGEPGASAGSRRRAPVSSGRGGGGREMDRGGGYSRGGYGSERPQAMRGERGGRGYAPAGRGDSRGGSGDAAPQVANWLLRFFDFSVEPGKKYKYRVQVVLQDPNQSSDTGNKLVASDTLDKAVQDRLRADKGPKKKTYRTTAWSDPSPTVSIPLAGNVRVAAAKPATERFNDEPTTTLLVESFGSDDKGKATQAAKEEDFHRGSVANMTKDVEILVDQGRAIDKQEKFKFQTGITILDIDGGEPLARDVKKPARVLLMDPAGQLFVHSEVDDTDAVQLHRDIFTETDRRGGRPGGRGEPGPPGGREGPRGAGGFQQGFDRGR